MLTLATFRLVGEEGASAASVTRLLGITPTDSVEAGDRVGRRSPRTATNPGWSLTSAAGIEDGMELATQLHRVLDVLEPRSAQLWQLVEQGWRAKWSCFLASHATEHAAELDRVTLTRLMAVPGDLWLDVCGDGDD